MRSGTTHLQIKVQEEPRMTNRRNNNVVEFPAGRQRAISEEPSVRTAQRSAERFREANDLLEKLRSRKERIIYEDRRILASNLGRQITDLDLANRDTLTKDLLGDNRYQHRTRYVRFPDEPHDGRYAASAGDIAKIITKIIEKKVSQGRDHAQATVDSVHDALRGTSFLPPSRFQMPENADDAAYFIEAMEKISNSLAQKADLPKYFELVSKYPVYPKDNYRNSGSLELEVHREPNNLDSWDCDYSLGDSELQFWIPWWAPKCVVGHLYVPVPCRVLTLPEDCVAEIVEACGGEITQDKWSNECLSLLEPLLDQPKLIHRDETVHHRLPIWLVVLPSPTQLVPCLYASVERHRDELQIRQSLTSETYDSYDNAITPCFVGGIGKKIDDDYVYFCGDDDFDPAYSQYILPFEDCVIGSENKANKAINVIGSCIDKDTQNFRAEIPVHMLIDDIPHWFHRHPVQRLLKLTARSNATENFALSPRIFTNCQITREIYDNETRLRPAFFDPLTENMPRLRQNTIAAYLLRNLVNAGDASIFEALKNDALAKTKAVREAIEIKLSSFQENLDIRYK